MEAMERAGSRHSSRKTLMRSPAWELRNCGPFSEEERLSMILQTYFRKAYPFLTILTIN